MILFLEKKYLCARMKEWVNLRRLQAAPHVIFLENAES